MLCLNFELDYAAALAKRLAMIIGEALDAVARRHVPKSRAPKRQRIDQALAKNDLLRARQGLLVPYASMRPGQIQVHRRPLAQVVVDLPPVHLHDAASFVEDRDHDGAVQMLVPILAQKPKRV